MSRIAWIVVGLAAAVGLTAPAAAQTAPNWIAAGARLEVLHRTGDHIEGTHLVLWFPPSPSKLDAEALPECYLSDDACVALVALTPAGMGQRLDTMAGRPLAEFRAEWLTATIGSPQ